MVVRNRAMLARGYAPAAWVANELGKALTTVHRMVDDGRFEGCNDGRALYILVASVEAHYAGNPVMVGCARALGQRVATAAKAA